MRSPRRRSGGRGGRSGWLSAVLGLGALAGVGFGLGVLAGGLWEEPRLVLSYLLGGTEEIAWSGAGQGEPLPSVAAEPPRTGRATAAPPASAPPPPAGRLAVQVGAFSESRTAEALADSLRAKGYPVYVSPGAQAGEARWRVRVGPLPTREEADRTATRLKRVEKLPTWVLGEDR